MAPPQNDVAVGVSNQEHMDFLIDIIPRPQSNLRTAASVMSPPSRGTHSRKELS